MLQPSKSSIRTRLYLQRILIGLFFLLALSGWLVAIQAGRHLDAYWRHVHWVQRLAAAGERERALQEELHQTLASLFEALEDCECRGDAARGRELWRHFTALLDREARQAAHTRQLLADYERAMLAKGGSP